MRILGGMVAALTLFTASCASRSQPRSQPRSCDAAAWSMVADGVTRAPYGQGASEQTAMWQRRCEVDRTVAAYNAQLELERQQLQEELRRQRELDTERLELERRRLEIDAEQARLAGTAPSTVSATAPTSTDQRPLIFGGSRHDVFLGCLCDESDPASVLNEYGKYGKGSFGTETLWNDFGQYGSSFSSYSACNAFASDPPVVVLRDGTFIGRLTLNKWARGAITNEAVVEWLEKSVCSGS